MLSEKDLQQYFAKDSYVENLVQQVQFLKIPLTEDQLQDVFYRLRRHYKLGCLCGNNVWLLTTCCSEYQDLFIAIILAINDGLHICYLDYLVSHEYTAPYIGKHYNINDQSCVIDQTIKVIVKLHSYHKFNFDNWWFSTKINSQIETNE